MSATLQTNVKNWWLTERHDGTPIDRLFSRLDSLYAGKLTHTLKTPEAAEQWRNSWAYTLAVEGITGNEVSNALAVCVKRHPSFLPTCGEFILCMRRNNDPQTAHTEAIEQMHKRESGEDVWSHPAVYWAAVKIGAFDLNNLAWEQIKNRWTHALDEMRRRENIEPVPPRRVALPAPGRLSVPDDVAKKRMHDIMQNLTTKMSMGNGGVDMLKTD